MKIRKVNTELYPKAVGMLRQAFPKSNYEVQLVESFHRRGRDVHEWVCIHAGKAIAYIAFSKAYNGEEVCGLHLAPFAVKPEFRKQGVGGELLRFALRQDVIQSHTVFVLGNPRMFVKFGFELCSVPRCPFDTNNEHFLSLRNAGGKQFTVGYETEFGTGG
jgi:putative acetyltransferase